MWTAGVPILAIGSRYASTYTVGSDVDVSGLATGDTVRVIGTVNGDTATATSVQSGATRRAAVLGRVG